MQKIPTRKLFEKGRNSLDLKNFVEETKFIASDRGEAVELFKLNILLVPKLPCGQKEAQQKPSQDSRQEMYLVHGSSSVFGFF